MLPKNKRLKRKQDIDAIFKYGISIKGSLIICKYIKNDLNLDRPGFSFAKNLKLKAFQRNRLKRQLVNAYKEVVEELKLKDQNTYDMFFILMRDADETSKSFIQFKNELKNLITKIKCQKNS
jgi:ribonuclease P protein component